jgi:dienelactone hydrolase
MGRKPQSHRSSRLHCGLLHQARYRPGNNRWAPVAACREYVKRLQQLGKDVQLTEYARANHVFDNPLNPVHEFLTLKSEPADVSSKSARGESS